MDATWLTTIPKQNDIPSAQGQHLKAKLEIYSDSGTDWIRFH